MGHLQCQAPTPSISRSPLRLLGAATAIARSQEQVGRAPQPCCLPLRHPAACDRLQHSPGPQPRRAATAWWPAALPPRRAAAAAQLIVVAGLASSHSHAQAHADITPSHTQSHLRMRAVSCTAAAYLLAALLACAAAPAAAQQAAPATNVIVHDGTHRILWDLAYGAQNRVSFIEREKQQQSGLCAGLRLRRPRWLAPHLLFV